MKIAGLFSGIGGLELPFRNRGDSTELLCDVWDASQEVLRAQFPGVPIHGDIGGLRRLPRLWRSSRQGSRVRTCLKREGPPALAGRNRTGLTRLSPTETQDVEWLRTRKREEHAGPRQRSGDGIFDFTIGKPRISLGLSFGRNSRFCGVPQRRHRVLFVASRHDDPRRVLFADNADPPDVSTFRDDAFGFYWTEGLRGLGWARDSVPPLKGGSAVGIPSPPGIWMPGAPPGMRIVTPSIEDAEALQGFERGWTKPATPHAARNGPRWKLVGNAVTVGVAEWLVDRLARPGDVTVGA